MIVDGRTIASDILKAVKETVGETPLLVRAIVVAPSPATESYLKIKTARAEEAGMRLEALKLPESASEEEVIAAIHMPGADAVIVQLPIPEHLYTEKILNETPVTKDADVLSAAAYERFENNEPGALVPPVAGAVAEVLLRANVSLAGKKTVVVGRGKLVGKPVAVLLKRMGAEVTVIHRSTENKEELYRSADIIVSGVGSAHLITPDLIKEGAVLIDAGTSGAYGGVAGDFHPDCATKASVFTPVPGGIGPIAVACLFKNVASFAQR
jgi:methylenetetrahydrofolate dehydrogenase (NADP+) / methenyltetrahydrofolate cyclohydrolase